MFIYWHVKITGLIRTLESAAGNQDGYATYEALRYGAGCRALPYLVRALDPAKNPYFLERATLLLAIGTDEPGIKGDWWSVGSPHGREWRISLDDQPVERKLKCERVREYWFREGFRHHQTWRIWTRQCSP
jgi:hypothetical protein